MHRNKNNHVLESGRTGSLKLLMQLTGVIFLIFVVAEPLVLSNWFIR